MDDAAAQRNASALDELVEDTSALSATLKRRVKSLEAQGGSSRDGQVKKQQVRSVSFCPNRPLTSCIGCVCEVEVCRGYPKLPIGGTAIPNEVQAENGEAV